MKRMGRVVTVAGVGAVVAAAAISAPANAGCNTTANLAQQVYVFQHTSCGGGWVGYSNTAKNSLGAWDNQISSILVSKARGSRVRSHWFSGLSQTGAHLGLSNASTTRNVVFNLPNYGRGDDTWNDAISSFSVT